MSDRALRILMALLATATTGIAAYLLQAHYAGSSVVCSTGGCETVQQSSYSEIFGIPVALVGLLGAVAILASLVRGDTTGRAAGVALAVSGFIFAAYLVIVQLAVIHAICEWCVASDSLVTVMAAVALWRARNELAATSSR